MKKPVLTMSDTFMSLAAYTIAFGGVATEKCPENNENGS